MEQVFNVGTSRQIRNGLNLRYEQQLILNKFMKNKVIFMDGYRIMVFSIIQMVKDKELLKIAYYIIIKENIAEN